MSRSALTNEELSVLKSCYELMREMEKTSRDGHFSEQDLFRLSGLLRSFAVSESSELEKLSLIPEHLHPQMSLRHFLNFLVPVERMVGRNLSDDSFLVTTQDRAASVHSKVPLYFVLENIRSAFNVGSIFRLADCLAAQKIYLCGYTPTPAQEALQKTSLGTVDSTPWEQKENLNEALTELKSQGVRLIALETAQNSKSLFDCTFNSPTAFVVGNERFGLEASALALCDQVVSIPTFGLKNSLNVSNALSIVSYEWRRQWK
jgi:23S rRNA (guanosine2251-2'-O)-methyltransferase